jgi:hypothetical protein
MALKFIYFTQTKKVRTQLTTVISDIIERVVIKINVEGQKVKMNL